MEYQLTRRVGQTPKWTCGLGPWKLLTDISRDKEIKNQKFKYTSN